MQFIIQTVVAFVFKQLESGASEINWPHVQDGIDAYVDRFLPEVMRSPANTLIAFLINDLRQLLSSPDNLAAIARSVASGNILGGMATLQKLVVASDLPVHSGWIAALSKL